MTTITPLRTIVHEPITGPIRACLQTEVADGIQKQMVFGRLVNQVSDIGDAPLRSTVVSMPIEDLGDLHNLAVRKLFVERIAYAVATFIDSNADDGLASLHSEIMQHVGTSGIDLESFALERAIVWLSEGAAPMHNWALICSPQVHATMLTRYGSDFVRFADEVDSDDAVAHALCGHVFQIPAYRSSLCYVGPCQSFNWLLQKQAVELKIETPEPFRRVVEVDGEEMQTLEVVVPYRFRVVHDPWIVLVRAS